MTEENYKKLGNWVPVLVLFIQLLIFVAAANAQIGCTREQIVQSDTLFDVCDNYKDCIITEYTNKTAVAFNFTDDICTQVTIYTEKNSNDYLSLILAYRKCSYESFHSKIRYSSNNIDMVYILEKINKTE